MFRSTAELLDRLTDYWRSTAVSAYPGATRDEIRECEAKLGVPLPTELASFYERFNGFKVGNLPRLSIQPESFTGRFGQQGVAINQIACWQIRHEDAELELDGRQRIQRSHPGPSIEYPMP